MALTQSTMLPLGTPLPDFSLEDVASGKRVTSATLPDSRGYLLMIICNHCPYVVHQRPGIVRFARRAQSHGFEVLAISANDASRYPADGPTKMRELAQADGFSFPYLYDKEQTLVKALHAACTPEFYFFDSSRKLVYRGQLDDSRPGNDRPNDAADLEAVMQGLLGGTPVPQEQKASIGCSIKWK